VRKLVFECINSIDCSFEAYVGRKAYDRYEKTHKGKEAEFYSDMLSHLLKNKLNAYEKLVLNISNRGTCTTHTNLEKGLQRALVRANPTKNNNCKVTFNVQNPTAEPLLNIADYFCWATQRVFERGECRYYEFLIDKFSLVVDVYDTSRYHGNQNYYNKKNPLTEANQLK
jgi:hypothetical protein